LVRRGFRIFFIAGGSAALALALAACSSGPQGKPTARSPDDGRGAYKVGKAYDIDGKTYYPAENWSYDETGMASWYGPGFHGKSTASGELYDQNATSAAHPTLPLPSIVRVTNLDNGRQVVARVNDRGPFAHNRIIDLSKGAARQIGLDISGTAKVRVQLLTRESEMIKQVALQGGGRDAQMAAIANMDSGAPVPAPQTMIASAPVTDRSVTVHQVPAPQGPTIAEQIAAREAGERTAQANARQAPVTTQPMPVLTLPPSTQALVVAQPTPSYAPPLSAASLGNGIYVQAGAFSLPENAERLRAQLSTLGAAQVMQTSVSGRDFYRVRIGPMASLDAADQLRARVIAAGHGEARVVSE
jgi:rare lipoprotein A